MKYLLGKSFNMIRKKTIEYSDFCITESNLFFKKLKLNIIKKHNSKVIHIKKFQNQKPNFKSTKEMSIVYVGNIGKIYDFDSLFSIIKGVEKKRKIILHIIGYGPMIDWFFDNLRTKKIEYYYHGASFDETFKREIISKCWFGFNGFKKYRSSSFI